MDNIKLDTIINHALSHSDKGQSNVYKKFFKCGEGEYGYGDLFVGIKNPILRDLSKTYKHITIDEAFELLTSEVHEIRLLALFILELKVKNPKTTDSEKHKIAQLYLNNTNHINNWDLVDSSAHHLLGSWAYNTQNNAILINLAKCKTLWGNRIAIIATLYHIRKNNFDPTLQIAEILINHPHDLIHKAVGWMLREIGKRNLNTELAFLKKHYKTMPRTMLRYAIEKFDEPLRKQILLGNY